MSDFYGALKDAFEKMEIHADEKQLDQCSRYAALLVEKNKSMNLTGLVDAEDVAIKHFCDSLFLLKYVDIPLGASIIDIGTGAGFPGLPLKIMRPDLQVALLDSLDKRCKFLREVIGALALKDIDVVWSRAEDGGRDEKLRGAFDYGTARAVASLPMLIEYALPYLKIGGCFLPLKGRKEELPIDHALKELGGILENAYFYQLPLVLEERSIYQIKKVEATPDKYPRSPGKIKKTPL